MAKFPLKQFYWQTSFPIQSQKPVPKSSDTLLPLQGEQWLVTFFGVNFFAVAFIIMFMLEHSS
jgi:hypothetical protein